MHQSMMRKCFVAFLDPEMFAQFHFPLANVNVEEEQDVQLNNGFLE